MGAPNLPLLFAELLAAGVLITKGAQMFASAFQDGGGQGDQVENLGQGPGGSVSGAGPMPGASGVKAIWLGAQELAKAAPAYVWGGGHGSNALSGADCSGAISYVLQRAGLLKGTLTSGQFMQWGDAGQGQWVTVWANPTHVLMSITTAGSTHWFGTSGFGHPDAPNKTGANWFTVAPSQEYLKNFTPRHPAGL